MSSQTRICFVLLTTYGYFDPGTATASGGGGRQYYLLSRELADRYDVHVVVGDYGQPQVEQRGGVTLHRAYTPGEGRATDKPAQLYALYRAMRRADADVYVYRGYPWKAAFVYGVTRVLGRPWVYNLNSDDHFRSYRGMATPLRWLFERGIADARSVIVQTDEQADRIRSTFGRESIVIPNGYHVAEERLPHDEREFFLWVGRITANQKRPHLYLDLAERLPEASFVLIGPPTGDEQYCQRIEQRVERLDNVRYLGSVDPSEIHDYYRRSIALINTSRYEGFPSTFPEAWRYETPVVTLSIPLSNYLPNPVVDSAGSMDRLVDIVDRLRTDTAYRERVSQSSYRYFQQHLRFDNIAPKYEAAITNRQ